MTPSTTPFLLTTTQAAAHLQMSKRFIYKAVSRGDLRFVRIGRYLRFRPDDLVEYVDARVARR